MYKYWQEIFKLLKESDPSLGIYFQLRYRLKVPPTLACLFETCLQQIYKPIILSNKVISCLYEIYSQDVKLQVSDI